MKDQLSKAIEDFRRDWPNIEIEVTRKPWPADGIVYIRMHTNTEGREREEWTMLTNEFDYDKARSVLMSSCTRLSGGK